MVTLKGKIMDIIVLSIDQNLYTTKRLLEEILKLKHNAKHINPFKQHISLNNYQTNNKHNSNEILIHRTTGVRFDDFDLNFSSYMEMTGTKIVNSIESMRNLRNKFTQTIFLQKNSIPTIPSIALRGVPPKLSSENIEEYFSNFKQFNKTESFILKTICGSKGIGVNLINGHQSLNSILETFHAIGDQKFILQPYLQNIIEYRVLIAGNKLLGCIQKSDSKSNSNNESNYNNDFRNNSNRRSSTFLKENNIPKDVLDLAILSYNISGCMYAGIDILKWQEEVLVLEINLSPGIKYMEEKSSKNIASELIKTIL